MLRFTGPLDAASLTALFTELSGSGTAIHAVSFSPRGVSISVAPGDADTIDRLSNTFGLVRQTTTDSGLSAG